MFGSYLRPGAPGRRLATAALAVVLLAAAGCAAPAKPLAGDQVSGGPGPGVKECPTGTAAQYFPYKPGTKASFTGHGHEFAGFTLDVLRREGDLIEWRRDTGGTTMAEVLRVTPQEVKVIYAEGEAYDKESRLGRAPNQDQVWLKAPVKVGTRWQTGDAQVTILQTEGKVQAMGRELDCVVTVEAKSAHAIIRRHYHQTYGLVLVEFRSVETPDTVIESRLASFTP